MGEEASHEVAFLSADGRQMISVCGGYGRRHLCIGIGDPDDLPTATALLGHEETELLRSAIAEMDLPRVHGRK